MGTSFKMVKKLWHQHLLLCSRAKPLCKAFQFTHERKGRASGVATEKLGPHQGLPYPCLHLDPIAAEAPACVKSVAAVATPIFWDIL